MLAFSTCWNNSRHTDGEAMIEEIVDLGFSHIELSHGMTIAKLPLAKDIDDFTFDGATVNEGLVRDLAAGAGPGSGYPFGKAGAGRGPDAASRGTVAGGTLVP